MVSSVLGPGVHWEVEGAFSATGRRVLWPGLFHQQSCLREDTRMALGRNKKWAPQSQTQSKGLGLDGNTQREGPVRTHRTAQPFQGGRADERSAEVSFRMV